MRELPSGRHLLYSGAQLILDLSVLTLAFVLAYQLRFDFDPPANIVHVLLAQIPFVVLLQFVALTLAGGRNFMWRYTGIAHVRSFLYAAFGSMVVIALMRLALRGVDQ